MRPEGTPGRWRRCRRGTVAAIIVGAVGPGCDVPTAPPRVENTLVVAGPVVQVPVLGVSGESPPLEFDFSGVDRDFAVRARRGELQVTPVPEVGGGLAGTGTLQVTLTSADGSVTLTRAITIEAEGTPQVIVVEEAEIQAFLAGSVWITVAGALGPAAVPVRYVTLETLVRVITEFGGEA